MNLVNPGLTASAIPVLGREQIFTTSDTFTPSKSGEYLVYCIGGGGGGGSGEGTTSTESVGRAGGQGGLEADIAMSVLSLVAGTAYTITIGSGGAGGPIAASGAGTNGSAGGDTTFDVLLTATGGAGGIYQRWYSPATANGIPGWPGLGNSSGQGGLPLTAVGSGNSGAAGSGTFGCGGGGGGGALGDGSNAYNGGAGGAGAPGSAIIIW